jgi:hypothetical protein
MNLRNTSFGIKYGEETYCRIGDLRARAKGRFFKKQGADIELSAYEVDLPDPFWFSKVSVEIKVKGQVVSIEEFKAELWGGQVGVKGEVDMESMVNNHFLVNLRKLNVARIPVTEQKAQYSGTIYGDLNIKLTDDGFKGLAGKGNFRMDNFRMQHLKFRENPVVKMFLPNIEEIKLEKLTGTLSFCEEKIGIHGIKSRGDPLNIIEGQGELGMDGYLKQSLTCTLAPDFMDSLPQTTKKMLIVNEQDEKLLKCIIQGNLPELYITIDEEHKSKVIGNILKNVQRSLKDVFR